MYKCYKLYSLQVSYGLSMIVVRSHFWRPEAPYELLVNLHHRHVLPLTRPAVSSRRGTQNGLERAAKIEPTSNQEFFKEKISASFLMHVFLLMITFLIITLSVTDRGVMLALASFFLERKEQRGGGGYTEWNGPQTAINEEI